MRSLIIMGALGYSTMAAADERKDAKPWNMGQHLGNVQTIEGAESVVDIPLYRSATSGHAAHVAVKTDKEDKSRVWFFRFSSRKHGITVTDEFVKANKLKVNTTNKRLIPYPSEYATGGQLKYVTIPELHLGGVVLKNVTAAVSSSKGSFDISKHLEIGMGAIPQLSYAVLQSKGKIQLVNADQGAKLLTAVGGNKESYETSGWEEVKHGKTKKIAGARSLLVNVKIGGSDVLAALEVANKDSSFSWRESASEISRNYGDKVKNWHEVSFNGKQSENGWLWRDASFSAGIHRHDAKIGANFLKNFDIAVDQQNFELTIKPTLVNNWESVEKANVAYYLEQTKPDAEGNEADGSDWNKLGAAYKAANDYAAAEKAYKKAAELSPEKCKYHSMIGITQVLQGKTDDAEKSFQTSSKLYHDWWDLSLEDRLKIKKSQASMDKKAKKNAKEKTKENPENKLWHHIQPGSCHKADGDLAVTMLAKGQHKELEKMYRERLDLDADVAMIYGNSKLINGDLTQAHEAYRQALILEDKPLSKHRLGLALYFADQGEWRFAAPLFEEALKLNPGQTLSGALWLDNARTHDPKTDNLKRAKEWRDANPGNSAAQFLWAREAKISNAKDYESTIKTVNDFFDLKISHSPTLLNVSAHIQFLVLTEKFGEAEAQISKFNFWKNKPEMLLAQAELQSAQGNTDAAQGLLRKAGSNAGSHPGYALFLKK